MSRRSFPTLNPSPVNALGQSHCPIANWPLHVEVDEVIGENDPLPNIDSLHELPMGIAYAKTLRSRTKKSTPGPFPSGEPVKAMRASKQYIYDANGQEYLDCVNATAHVGHCHPQVVSAGQSQLAQLCTAQGFRSQHLNSYIKELISTMPDPLNVCYLCNSGSEANDLGIRLARQYTGNEDILVHEDTYYGNLGTLVDISPKLHSEKAPGYKVKEWVKILSLPNRFRGQFSMDEVDVNDISKKSDRIMELYLDNALNQLNRMKSKGARLSALVMDPFLVIPGLHKPSKKYMQSLFVAVRQMGGLVIMDEVQTGLGRMGEHFWGFQHFGVLPDIVTVGKPLGSGHPIGAVFCTKEVSEKLGGYYSTFGGNPVSCVIGMATLSVIFNEKLVMSAENVGRMHGRSLREIMKKFPHLLGDVRGQGLLWTLEFIADKKSRKPNPDLARSVMFGLKAKHILVAVAGKFKHIIFFNPPMCFTITNSRRFCSALEEVLSICSQSPELQALGQAEQAPSKVSRKRSKLLGISTKESISHSISLNECLDSTSDEDSSSGEGYDKLSKEEAIKRARLEVEEYEQMD